MKREQHAIKGKYSMELIEIKNMKAIKNPKELPK